MPVDAAAAAQAHVLATVSSSSQARAAYVACFLLGLGGLFSGVTGPLLSNFVPLIIRDTLGDARTAIGGVMAIDSPRARRRGRL